ncbi:hypothetical protein [Mycolicibacterium fortuitum]|nr:hypothetical protein [Mycolicibacterium fortuitum]
MQDEKLVQIGWEIGENSVPGVDQRAGRGPADPDTVEDGSASAGSVMR